MEGLSPPGTSEGLHKYSDGRDFTSEGAANHRVQYVGVHAASRVQCRERHPRCPATWGCKEPDRPKVRREHSPRDLLSTGIPGHTTESTSPRKKPEVKDFKDGTTQMLMTRASYHN